jgi:hypothetical protein
VGSIDAIVPPGQLRPYLIDAVERGMERERRRCDTTSGEPGTSPPVADS